MLKKLKMSVDGSVAFGQLLKDLIKAFDFLDHEFTVAKLDQTCEQTCEFSWPI